MTQRRGGVTDSDKEPSVPALLVLALRNWLIRRRILCSTCGGRLRSAGCTPDLERRAGHTLYGGVEGRA